MIPKKRLRKGLAILVIMVAMAAFPVYWYYANPGMFHGSVAKQDMTLTLSQRLQNFQTNFPGQLEGTIVPGSPDRSVAGYPSDPKPTQSQNTIVQIIASLKFQNGGSWIVLLSILFILVSAIMIWLVATSLSRDGVLGWSFLLVMIFLILAVVFFQLGIRHSQIFGLIVTFIVPVIDPVLSQPDVSWIWIGAGSVIAWIGILAGAIRWKNYYLAWAAGLIPVWAAFWGAFLIIFDKTLDHRSFNFLLVGVTIFYGLILITFSMRAAGFAVLKRFFPAGFFLFLAIALFFSILLPYPWL